MRRSVPARGLVVVLCGLLTACGTTAPLLTTSTVGVPGSAQAGAGDGSGPVGPALGSAASTARSAVSDASGLPSQPADSGRAGSVPGVTAGSPTPAGTGGTPGQQPLPPASTTTSAAKSATVPTRARPGSGRSSAGPAKGAAEKTLAPITIGLTYQDNSGIDAALGAVTPPSASPKTVSEALVAGLNAAGGLDGHKLVPIEYSFNTDSDSYSSDATAACAMFTQDNHVPLVIDLAFGTIGGFSQCLQKAGVLDINTSDDGDRTADQADPLHASTLYMTLDREYASVLDGLTSTGYLSKTNQLGIVLEQCPEDLSAYNNTVAPLIKQLGLKPAITASIDCTTGFGSAESDSAPLTNAVLTFRTDGVDRVMFMSTFEDVLFGLFAILADSQGYKPGWALSTLAEARDTKADLPQDQWPQINGVGYVPGLDVDDTGVKPTAVESRCLTLAAAGGVTAADYDDATVVYWYCAPFLLVESALEADGDDTTPARIMAAIDAEGSKLAGPGLLGDATRYDADHHDAPDKVQVFSYVASCQCVRYSGSPMQAPA